MREMNIGKWIKPHVEQTNLELNYSFNYLEKYKVWHDKWIVKRYLIIETKYVRPNQHYLTITNIKIKNKIIFTWKFTRIYNCIDHQTAQETVYFNIFPK